MKLAAIIQKPAHGPEAMSARSVMEMATVNGAETLGMMNTIGSLEKGKKADIVFLDLGRVWNPPRGTDDVYSSIVYSCGPENVRSVMVDGKWLYRDGQHLTIDEALAAETASAELRRLLMRVNSYA
jgi:cytosine/adenosine deaminase-related metal-dependent hydrolase